MDLELRFFSNYPSTIIINDSKSKYNSFTGNSLFMKNKVQIYYIIIQVYLCTLFKYPNQKFVLKELSIYHINMDDNVSVMITIQSMVNHQ